MDDSTFEESSPTQVLCYDRSAAGSLIMVPQILSHPEQGKRQYTDDEDKNKG